MKWANAQGLSDRITGLIVVTAAVAYFSVIGLHGTDAEATNLESGFEALQSVAPDRTPEAVQHLKAALAEDTASPYRWCDLGEAYLLSGNPSQTAYCYRRGLALSPQLPAIRLRMVNFLLRSGDVPAATALMPALLADAPQSEQVLLSYYERLHVTPPHLKGAPSKTR